ncbi:MAG: hypothetical protein ACRENE_22905, partial [Polyangiaceae bacterium]
STGKYRITATLRITASNVVIHGDNSGSTEIYTDAAAPFALIASDAPDAVRVQLRLEDVSLHASTPNTAGWIGVDLTGFQYSYLTRVNVLFKSAAQPNTTSGTGVRIRGSDAGNAAYYDRIDELVFESGRGPQGRESVGIDFAPAPNVNAHGPNNNRIFGGHLSGSDFGIRVGRGQGNTIVGVGIESVAIAHYEFGLPDVPCTVGPNAIHGCVSDNQVFGGYDESMSTAHYVRFNVDTLRNVLFTGYATGLHGVREAGFIEYDRGSDNRLVLGGGEFLNFDGSTQTGHPAIRFTTLTPKGVVRSTLQSPEADGGTP